MDVAMDAALSGPSTRHAKHRRPSYHTKTARAVASLEVRIAVLEGKTKATDASQQSPSPSTKSHAASEVDADLKEFGDEFTALDGRVEALERAAPVPTQSYIADRLADVEAQLARMSELIKPYAEYKAECLAAVGKLEQFQAAIRAPDATKAAHSPSKVISEQAATLRDVADRLAALEHRPERSQAHSLSTRELAQALTKRLKRGELLDNASRTNLKRSLEDTEDEVAGPSQEADTAPRQQDTPVTDTFDGQASTVASNIEEIRIPRPHKRRRTEPPSITAAETENRTNADTLATPQPDDAPRKLYSGNSAKSPKRVATGAFATPKTTTTPEPRRTGRKPAPLKYDDMVPWKEANMHVKHVRPSARKSLS